MKRRRIGILEVSEVGIGCNNFGARLDFEGTKIVVDAALASGINFFDTADTYGSTQSEVLLGQALGNRRDEAIIATKFGMPLDDTRWGASPAYVKSACEASLERLGTDYIDLYQLHFPDSSVPIADTLGALHELIAEGKIREIGCSNLNPEQLREAHAVANGHSFMSVQNQYSLLAREPETDGILDTCTELGIGFLPYYPLANGWLTGKIKPGEAVPEGTRLAMMPADRAAHWLGEAFQERAHKVLAYADEVKVPILSLAFSWLLSHPQVSCVIAGASNAAQVESNAAAVMELSDAVIAGLNEASSL
jgi:aryl-alcohol dehydrogenase-like predicted oxidoreductase